MNPTRLATNFMEHFLLRRTRRQSWIVVLAVGLVMSAFGNSSAQDSTKPLIDDSFKPEASAVWQTLPSGAKVDDGVLLLEPEGQQWIVSSSKYQHGQLEMTVRFNRLSDDSHLFYYLGFQSVLPWARQVCWLQVQDSQMSLIATRDGTMTINVPVLSGVKADEWYRLKLQWTARGVIVRINGELVFDSSDKKHGLSSAGRAAELIPIAPMYVFLAANSLDVKKSRASLSIDHVKLSGGRPARASRPPVTKHTAPLNRDQKVGSVDQGLVELRDGRIRLENAHLSCEWNAATGLSWRQLSNKSRNFDYLYESDNSPLFIVMNEAFYCDSRDCVIEQVRVDDTADRRLVELSLRHSESNLTFQLGASLDAAEDPRLWLRLHNDATESRRVQTIFPIVGRVRTDGERSGLRYFYPWRSGIVGDADAYLMNEYGNLAWMQVMSVFDPKSGAALSLFPRDSSGEIKGLILKKQGTEARSVVRHCEVILQEEVPSQEPLDFDQGLGMANYALPRHIAPGESIEYPQVSLTIYNGDWKPALSEYSRWLHTWYRRLDTSAWFRDSYGFMPIHPPSFYSYEKQKYVAAENFRGRGQVFQWAGWDDYRHDPQVPNGFLDSRIYRPGDFEVNQERGGIPAFRDEVKRIQENGSRVTLYIDHRFCWSGTKTHREHAAEWAAEYQPGIPAIYSKRDETCMCFLERKAWADYVAKRCGDLVRETGLDGVYLDELNLTFPCYNAEHEHNRNGIGPVSTAELSRHVTAVRDAMRRENPEAILMTEHAGSDYLSQFVDGSWVQTYYRTGFPFAEEHYDAESLIYFRFVCPEFKLAEWGSNADGLRRCLFNGIGLIGHDYPGAEAVIQTLAENGDAFSTLQPEPHVATLVPGVLSNRFPGESKLVYTVYNKTSSAVSGALLEVDAKSGWRWVDCVSDQEVEVKAIDSGHERLCLSLEPAGVACLARLERLLGSNRNAKGDVVISVARAVPEMQLAVSLDGDTGRHDDLRKVTLTDNRAVINAKELFGREGVLIVKLSSGGRLVDQLRILP